MQKRKRVTIKDVAKETGLAVSTISNALAGKPHVTDETREIVQRASERLGYRASMVARALRLQRSFIIGVLIADVANPSSAEFVRGVEDVANREKCTLLLCNTDGDEERQLRHMQTLVDQRVDGMVLISQHCSSGPVPRSWIRAFLSCWCNGGASNTRMTTSAPRTSRGWARPYDTSMRSAIDASVSCAVRWIPARPRSVSTHS